MGEEIKSNPADSLRAIDFSSKFLEHHGILGMHWGQRRFQNKDGSLTSAGKNRYAVKAAKKALKTKKANEKAAQRKQKILRDPKLLSKHASEFTDAELQNALRRFQTQESIRKMSEKSKSPMTEKQRMKLEYKQSKKLEKQRAKNEAETSKQKHEQDLERIKTQAEIAQRNKEAEKKTLKYKLAYAADVAKSVATVATSARTAYVMGKDLFNKLDASKKEKAKKEAEASKKANAETKAAESKAPEPTSKKAKSDTSTEEKSTVKPDITGEKSKIDLSKFSSWGNKQSGSYKTINTRRVDERLGDRASEAANELSKVTEYARKVLPDVPYKTAHFQSKSGGVRSFRYTPDLLTEAEKDAISTARGRVESAQGDLTAVYNTATTAQNYLSRRHQSNPSGGYYDVPDSEIEKAKEAFASEKNIDRGMKSAAKATEYLSKQSTKDLLKSAAEKQRRAKADMQWLDDFIDETKKELSKASGGAMITDDEAKGYLLKTFGESSDSWTPQMLYYLKHSANMLGISFDDLKDTFIAHYGVKGMTWSEKAKAKWRLKMEEVKEHTGAKQYMTNDKSVKGKALAKMYESRQRQKEVLNAARKEESEKRAAAGQIHKSNKTELRAALAEAKKKQNDNTPRNMTTKQKLQSFINDSSTEKLRKLLKAYRKKAGY